MKQTQSMTEGNIPKNPPAIHRKSTTTNLDQKFNKKNMVIAIRSRPLSARELEFSNIDTIKIHNREIVTVINPLEYHYSPDSSKYVNDQKQMEITKSKEHQFAFDFAFDEKASQELVYKYTTEYLLSNVIEGFNATVFAYGATGSGKTYTMVGNGENPGLMIRAISDLFLLIEKEKKKAYTIQISYIEVYNETLKDLLSDGHNDNNIDIRNDPQKGVSIIGATVMNVTNANDAFKLLIRGNKKRRETPTIHNENSSRSHALLEIRLQIKEQISGLENAITFGKFILVDLAGSEKITTPSKANNESGSINKSLLALANCINTLVSQNKSFIPWRDSKLTRLLQDSLSGNSRIVMVATISPSIISLEDTLFTLQYANRAKNIKVSLTKNVIEQNFHISKYDDIIKALKLEIGELKQEIVEKEKANLVPNRQIAEEQSKDNYNEVIQNKIVAHFQEEIRIRKEIIEKERQIENIKNEIAENEYKFTRYDQEDKKNINMLLQAQRKEVEDIQKQMTNDYLHQSNLIKQRRELQQLITKVTQDNNLQNAVPTQLTPTVVQSRSLINLYKYYIALLENLNSEQRKFVNLNEIKRKDKQIQQLTEQLDYRDQFIYTAGIELQKVDVDVSYKNNKFQSADEIDLNPYKLPVIQIQPMMMSPENSKVPLASHGRIPSQGDVIKSPPIAITKRRQYNKELLPLISNTVGNAFLDKFQRKRGTISPTRVTFDTNTINTSQGNSPMNRINGLLSGKSRYGNNCSKLDLLLNSPVMRKYGYSPVNRSRQKLSIPYPQHRHEKSEDKTGLNRSSETNTSHLEMEMKQKTKTILKKDIIGRYKRSPYIRSEYL